jgi:ADP-ribosyl-[dinitrogen reductase] hydrolase
VISRSHGCLFGQLAGDTLGSLVEFQSPGEVRRAYPNGVRDLADGGTWNTIAGQPTDDSEMALLLARMLVERGHYDAQAALEAYKFWLNSGPFDCGTHASTPGVPGGQRALYDGGRPCDQDRPRTTRSI